MESNQYPTCTDDTVANAAADTEHEYAPGVVANAYHTLGPVSPSRLFTAHLRRTQFLQRPAGVSLDGWAMYPERTGGSAALYEGVVTLRRDLDVELVHYASLLPHSFPRDGDNVPLLALQTGGGVMGLGLADTFDGPHAPAGLGPAGGGPFNLEPGGTVALLPSRIGLPTYFFNADEKPMRARATRAFGAWWVTSPPLGPRKAGESFSYRFLTVYDALDEPAINTMRIESLRRYFGLTGENGCGLNVRRGKPISQFGLIEIEAENGVVDFEVPNPGWRVNLPLGFRFHGFNPNWTVGEVQVAGASQGFYTDGRNVYRQVGLDDRDLAHLSVYPDAAAATHCRIGHPVQCDRPDLILEFTVLRDQPFECRVAVNNPTDEPIRATLRQGMDVPSFSFADTTIEAPAGGYVVVRDH